MISCRDAQHLFDRYLDGELSPSLQTELHAHRLNCTACQNELAMAESFGDVIALDRSEPSLSGSFTDRILLARRTQLRPQRRNWSRLFLLGSSPLAAAASIALVFAVISPPRNKIMGVTVTNPNNATAVSPNALVTVPAGQTAMAPAVGLFEGLLQPLVEQSRSTLEGTRRSAQELGYLVHLGLSDTNQKLVAQWEANHAPAAPSVSAEPIDPDALMLAPDAESANQDTPSGTSTPRVLQPL